VGFHSLSIAIQKDFFLSASASRSDVGPTQSPAQWVPGALCLGVNWPRCEADYFRSSIARVKELNYTSTTTYAFMALCLISARDNFTLQQYKNQHLVLHDLHTCRTTRTITFLYILILAFTLNTRIQEICTESY
jgi:hypothetical protein